MSSGSKKRESRHAFSFFLESPSKQTPPGSPTGPLWTELPIYKAFFLRISQIPYKITLNKFIPSLRGPRQGANPMFPKSGGPMETDIHFQSLI